MFQLHVGGAAVVAIGMALIANGLAFAQKPVATETAVMQTSMGTFEIGLYRNDAPKTVENFVQLAKKKFFDGMRVHRVAKGFVIQTGDDKSKNPKLMSEWGTGGQSIYPHKAFDRRTNKMETVYTFEDELNAASPSYKDGYVKGVVAMANTGVAGTNTSQFFVLLTDHSGLPPSYTIFGKVTKGMDIVDKIGAVDIVPQMGPNDGRPKTDVLLKKVTIHPASHSNK